MNLFTPRVAATLTFTPSSTPWRQTCFSLRARATRFLTRTELRRTRTVAAMREYLTQCALFAGRVVERKKPQGSADLPAAGRLRHALHVARSRAGEDTWLRMRGVAPRPRWGGARAP